jgi:Domain of unknown function (DUF389)
VLGRWRLAGRAVTALGIGLAACVIAALLALVFDAVGALPAGFELHSSFLQGLAMVNLSTPIVAFVAGVVGILALETRASSAVAVAISVTTIPASAYLGVATGIGEVGKALGALLVLGVNVVMLLAGGSVTLLVQPSLAQRRQREAHRSRLDDATTSSSPMRSRSRRARN